MRDSKWRKRKRGDDGHSSRFGVGQTLALLRGDADPRNGHGLPCEGQDANEDGEAGEWHTVERRRTKKRKTAHRNDNDNYPSIGHSAHARLHSYVKLSDFQNLVLYLLADGQGPQWCSVRHHTSVRKVVALMVPGLEEDMFNGKILLSAGGARPGDGEGEVADSSAIGQKAVDASVDESNHPSSQPKVHHQQASPDDYYPTPLDRETLPLALQPLCDMFQHLWPLRTPGDDKYVKMHSPLAAMLVSPIAKTKDEKRAKGPGAPPEGKGWRNQRTPITEFVASTQQLAEEGYALHPAHFVGTKDESQELVKRLDSKTSESDGWKDTPGIPNLESGRVSDAEIEQGSILQGRKVLSVDCEMCITSPAGTTPQVFSLTRVSVIGWDGAVVMDEFVKPANEITDYLTPYSGITPAMLSGVTTTLEDIQEKLTTEILTPRTILIGHSLNSDLNALQISHPFIIDTSLLFPHPRGPPLKSSLKFLAQKYLSREIQKGSGSAGHDSIEDARACLDLVKQKCERGKAWGTSEAQGESIFRRLARHRRPKRDKVHAIGDDEPRLGAVVDWGDPSRGYGAQARVAIGCDGDDEVVAGVKRVVRGDTDDSSSAPVPLGGCDFVFARLRALEAHRGWWNRRTTAENDTLLHPTTTTTTTTTAAESSPSSSASLSSVVERTVAHIREIHDSLPPCSAFLVYSGSGDPRELGEMQALHAKFKEEYRVRRWDELSVRWTDDEEQRLREACRKARLGIGFVGVK